LFNSTALEFINIKGQVVLKSEKITEGKINIDYNFSPGLYFTHIKIGEKSFVKKFIVQSQD
jgi:hypothetical protein